MWNERKTQWSKRQEREKCIKRKIVAQNYAYIPTKGAISYAKYQSHQFSKFNENMIGVQSLEEILMFMKTFKNIGKGKYDMALEVALKKVQGRKFDDCDITIGRIKSAEDVEQSIRALLRTAGISTPVKEYIKKATN